MTPGGIAIAVTAAVGVAACGSKPEKGEAAAEVPAARRAVAVADEPRIPSGPVPVTLPTAGDEVRRRIGQAKAFVVMSATGGVSVGPLARGRGAAQVTAPYDGVAIDDDETRLTLAGLIGDILGTPGDRYRGRRWNDPSHYLRLRGTFDMVSPIDVVVLADAAAPARRALLAVDVLDARVALAVGGGDAPDAFAFRPQAPGADYQVPAVRLDVKTDAVGVDEPYGGQRTVSSSGSVVDRAALATAIEANIDRYAGSRMAEVRLRDGVTVQAVVDVLAAVAAAKLSAVSLVSDPVYVDVDPPAMGGLSGSAIGTLTLAAPGDPVVTFDSSPTVTGGYSKTKVMATVKRSRDALETCYTDSLILDPTLAGTVIVDFMIYEDGGVWAPTALGVDPDLADCIERVFAAMAFTEPADGTYPRVSYHLKLSTDG
jgi:hypothetical protein